MARSLPFPPPGQRRSNHSHSNQADVAVNNVLEAGCRVTDAERLEEYFHKLSLTHPVEDVLRQWRTARELLAIRMREYVDLMARLNETAEETIQPKVRSAGTVWCGD